MDPFTAALTILSGAIALVIGYVLGYHSGKTAGELHAMKNNRHSSSRHRSSRRHSDESRTVAELDE